MVHLTEQQFQLLKDYFETALTAISDEEQAELVFMEKPLRDMLREVSLSQHETHEDGAGMTDQF